ncbi:hypothetical protein NI26_13290 [Curtobacterium sp. MR_MD2014]|nr:hypothetical protein NI26_13290 [Curtobacterium sp. MR_MD2014]
MVRAPRASRPAAPRSAAVSRSVPETEIGSTSVTIPVHEPRHPCTGIVTRRTGRGRPVLGSRLARCDEAQDGVVSSLTPPRDKESR